jgi:hypothetical protein
MGDKANKVKQDLQEQLGKVKKQADKDKRQAQKLIAMALQLAKKKRLASQEQARKTEEELAISQEHAAAEAEVQWRRHKNEVRQLELTAASTLAAVSVAARVPGLDDVELRALEAVVRAEHIRRAVAVEREEMRRAMAATLELEREALRRDSREEREECNVKKDRKTLHFRPVSTWCVQPARDLKAATSVVGQSPYERGSISFSFWLAFLLSFCQSAL